MTQIITLAPHDPVPDYGNHALVLRRMGEDDPNAVVIEIVFYGHDGSTMPAVHRNGHAMSMEEAIAAAKGESERRGLKTLYVVDRTSGVLEKEVLAHHGDHSFPGDVLSDTDPEDGVSGADMRDRPHDAGFMR